VRRGEHGNRDDLGDQRSESGLRISTFSRGTAEAGAGDVVVDVVVDDSQSGSEFGGCLGLIGGKEGAQEPVVEFGVENDDAGASGVRA
jgi:hypothetical protein